jgi:septal ring factor EnvC (AmiA/AmiB activator)
MPQAPAPGLGGVHAPGHTNGFHSAANGSFGAAGDASAGQDDADEGMTQEEAKKAAETALLSAAAEMKRISGIEWEEEYGSLSDLAAARQAQGQAMEEHEAILTSLREAFRAANMALAKKFQKLEAAATESQRSRMFILQRTASNIQRREYEATMYDITPASQVPPAAPSPPTRDTDSPVDSPPPVPPALANGFSFAPA